MTSRIEIAGSTVHPWQFPLLDEPKPAPPLAVAIPAPGEPEPAGAGDQDATGGDAQAVEALLEARLQQGYGEGFNRGFEDGRERGYAAGLAEGNAVARTELADGARRLLALIERLGAPITTLEQQVEEALAGLALEIARAVIGSEVSRSHDYLVRLIREAIGQVPIEMGSPKVVLNPADLDLVRSLAPELASHHATLVPDETIEPGGCLVVADGDNKPVKDRRWYPRAGEGASQVNLTLASRWRSVILALFDGEEG